MMLSKNIPPHLPDPEIVVARPLFPVFTIMVVALCAGLFGGIAGMYYVLPGIFEQLTMRISLQPGLSRELSEEQPIERPYGQMEKVTAQLFKQGKVVGSAVGFSNDGWLVTSATYAGTGLSVVFGGDASVPVQRVVVDEASRVAFIKINVAHAPISRTSDSEQFLLQNEYFISTPGMGVVTAQVSGAYVVMVDGLREVEQYERVLPLDIPASITEPGAPVFNEIGELVGIVSSYVTEKSTATMIPLIHFLPAYQSLVKDAKIIRPSLGVMVTSVARLVVDSSNFEEVLVVERVLPLSPAGKAGIQKGDHIVAIDGKEVGRLRSIADVLFMFKPGQKIEVTLQNRTVTVELGSSVMGVVY